MYISNILSEVFLSSKKNIDNIKYCDYLIEYPLANIIKFDWKNILENPQLNSSSQTYKELLYIEEVTSKRTKEQEDIVLNIDADANFLIKQVVKKYGLKYPYSFFGDFYSIVKPIIYNTKYYFNRARPYQIGQLLDIKIDTINTLTHNTPSYPSGHTVYTCLSSMILTEMYPKLKSEFDDLVKKTGECRVLQGVHYPSDNNASIIFTKFIFNKIYPILKGEYNGKIL